MSHLLYALPHILTTYYPMLIKPIFYSICLSNICCTLNNYPSENSKTLMVNNTKHYIAYLSAKALCLSVFWPYTIFKLITYPKHVLAFGAKYDVSVVETENTETGITHYHTIIKEIYED